jgi:PAS domain S-box-containing protein
VICKKNFKLQIIVARQIELLFFRYTVDILIMMENEEKYRKLIEITDTGYVIIDENGVVLDANEKYISFTGHEFLKEILNRNVLDWTADHVVDKNREAVRRCISQGFIRNLEIEYVHNDGKVVPIEIDATVIKTDSGISILKLCRDITMRKRVEEEIRETKELFQKTFELSPVANALSKLQGRIVINVNTAFENLFGYTRSELIGKPITDFDLWEKAEVQNQAFEILIKQSELQNYEFSFKTKSGKIGFGIIFAYIIEQLGEKYNLIKIIDITDHKQVQKELQESKELLEKLNKHLQDVREREQSQIALNLHDDIGQKLTAINLNIAWIKSRIGVQSKAVKERLEDLSLMIKETIDAVQDFSSVLRPAILFDLGLVSAFDAFLKRFETQSGIKCHFYHKQEEFKIENHISLILYRILQESVTNIARHSEASSAEVDLHLLRHTIVMSIKDNGVGIETDKINSEASMGITGMIERAHSVHGEIFIKGKKGSGTIIKVSIPLKNKDD